MRRYILIIFIVMSFLVTASAKGKHPSRATCSKFGGSLNKYGICETKSITNAKKMCAAVGRRLPTIAQFRKEVQRCGGVVGELNNNKNDRSYQQCMKRKGYSTNANYWSSTAHRSNKHYYHTMATYSGFNGDTSVVHGRYYWGNGRFSVFCKGGGSNTQKTVNKVDQKLIKSIQEKLNYLGYNAGLADGISGRKTKQAIREFQKSSGLTVDGKYSKYLLGKLKTSGTKTEKSCYWLGEKTKC